MENYHELQKKERLKLTPEQLFNIYLECTAPGAPVKTILERYGLKPWDLVAIRKKVRSGAIEALANAKPGRKKHRCGRRAVPASIKGAGRNQGRSGGSRARAIIAKKKSELALEGPLTGHFKKEVKEQVVNIIKEAVNSGLTQNQACLTFGLSPRKFRRWASPKPVKPRTAWNKILPQEHEAIKNAVYAPELLDKPLSHVFVHGHDTGKFFASLSTVFRVLKSENLVKPLGFYRTKKTNYVSAHALMKEGFSLLCYDATQF